MSIGERVELGGLQGFPAELNGQRGVIKAFDAAAGRLKVQLMDGRGPFSVKPENCFAVPSQEEEGRNPAAAEQQTPPATASPAVAFVGRRVELRGLNSKPELNGQRGVVTKFLAAAERFAVQLDGRELRRLQPTSNFK